MKPFENIHPQIAEVAKSYDYRQPPDFVVSVQQWLSLLYRWLQNLLESLRIHLPGVGDTSMVGTLMQVVLYAAGILGVLILVAVILGRVRQASRAGSKVKTGAATETILSSHGWQVEASRLAAAGEWRGSCRALYLSLLRDLDEKGITPYAPTKTNYEYWYALTRHPGIQPAFRVLANRVEVIWFGHATAGPDDFKYCQEQLAKAEQEIKQREGTSEQV